jgi:2',3'-cyclic-nucleotide 2'-phosphodiesterase (5'-nucleotidase family)
VPDGSLVLGGHDHLVIDQPFGRGRYVHTGAWGAVLSVATIAPGRPVQLRQVTVDPGGPADPVLKALIQARLTDTLTPAETAVVAAIPSALSLGDTGRAVAGLMARAAGCDIGFMGHTTLGMGLPAGPLTQYAYDAVVRFDGAVMRADVDAATLAALTALANQDRDTPFERRTGDFVYGAPAGRTGQARYAIATTDWCAGHQQTYFGRTDLVFTAVPGLKVKDAIRRGLPAA